MHRATVHAMRSRYTPTQVVGDFLSEEARASAVVEGAVHVAPGLVMLGDQVITVDAIDRHVTSPRYRRLRRVRFPSFRTTATGSFTARPAPLRLCGLHIAQPRQEREG
jgi:hypothetical protein